MRGLASSVVIVVEPPDSMPSYDTEPDNATDLELYDIEEIPLPAPWAIGAPASLALSETPFFSGLTSEVLLSMVGPLEMVSLELDQELFPHGRSR